MRSRKLRRAVKLAWSANNVTMPSHEFVTPDQLGALAVFLCSDAAAQMRGQALAMDGGWTAQ